MKDRYLYKAKVKDGLTGYKDLDWVIGNLIEEQSTERYFIVDLSHFDKNSKLNDIVIEVEPSTICKYTGLHDKNGELIWENDIVNCSNEDCYGYIGWNEIEAGFYFDVLLEDERFEEEHIYDYQDCMEVIGNRFDNAELLECNIKHLKEKQTEETLTPEKDLISEEERAKIVDTIEGLFNICTNEYELKELLDIFEDTIEQETENVMYELENF